MATEIIFWGSALFLVHLYIGYPVLVWLAGKLPFRRIRKEPFEPSVSILVAAYNEADVVAEKLRNCLALDYPPERFEVVVVNDGSKDGTASIIRTFIEREGEGRIRLLDFPVNRGKLTVLNEAVPQLRGEIVVFSDASSMLDPGALRKLMENFADPRVGAVSGRYRLIRGDITSLGQEDGLYWKYETFLKEQESKLGTVMGAHGALYALRKPLYPFPSPSTINDDFIIPMRILEKGHLVAYEPEAVATEDARENEGFGRRVRIAAGNVEQLREFLALLWPPRILVLFCFLSHKAGRLVAPLALLALAVSNLLLLEEPLYRWSGWGQIGFYGLALAGAKAPLRPRILRLPYYFCMVNAAVIAWLFRGFRRRRPDGIKVMWS